MNLTTTITSVTAAVLLWAGPFQEALKPAETPLSAGRAVADFDAAAWAKALRAPALSERKANYEELLVAARSSDEILGQVRAWAADESDVELAWTAHLMLRELEGRRGPGPLGRHAPRAPFWGGADPFDDEAFDRLFDDLRRSDPLRDFRGHLFGPGGQNPFQLDLDAFGPGSSQQSSGMSLEMGPDGVKVRIEESVDGKTETKTYEAESLEALLEAHPELEERIGKTPAVPEVPRWPYRARPGDDVFDAPSPAPPALEGRERWRRGPQGLRPLEPSLDQLGIQMLPPEHRAQSYAGVEAEVGLQVIEVVPGSLADAIGVRAGELVVSIAGHEIRSAADVKAALAKCSLDEEIDVECVTPEGKRRVRSWKPAATSEGSGLRTF